MSDKELERAKAQEAKEREQQEAQQAAEFSESMDKVGNALASSEAYIENNKNKLLIILGVVVVLVIGIIWYFKSRSEANEEANNTIYKAQSWFERDSFQLALDGNGDFEGFLEIADKYSSTDAGKLANAYAGICYKNLGNNEEAVKYLDKFSADGVVVAPAIYCAIGDCYWDLKNAGEAESFYNKAIESQNSVIAPVCMLRLAMLKHSNGDDAKAVEILTELKNVYPTSNEGRGADKFINLFQGNK